LVDLQNTLEERQLTHDDIIKEILNVNVTIFENDVKDKFVNLDFCPNRKILGELDVEFSKMISQMLETYQVHWYYN